MIILAVDPGGTCGMAEASLIEGKVTNFESWEAEPNDCVYYFDKQSVVFDHLVYETFTPRPGVRTWQPDALYTIGALRYIASRHDTPMHGQSPADAKKFSTDSKLKKIGWYRASKGGHKNDAARHLLLGVVRLNLIDAATLL